jgi:trans-aconitate 2-methyltransferase
MPGCQKKYKRLNYAKGYFMNSNNDWNPALYLKFRNERTQPSIDLVSRINISDPKSIIDIGCGPGNSTEILLYKWPNSSITGIDNSPAMIEMAQSDFPDQKWKIMDASEISTKEKYDIVFSNAAIQWIPNHEKLILNFIKMVNPNGALAIQVPLYHEMPICPIIDDVFNKMFGKIEFNCESIFTFHTGTYYYDILVNHVKTLEMWETSYIHSMNSCNDILEMIKSTGLKPYLEKITDDKMKNEFENNIENEINKIYLKQIDGKVLFPFKRLFFIGYM